MNLKKSLVCTVIFNRGQKRNNSLSINFFGDKKIRADTTYIYHIDNYTYISTHYTRINYKNEMNLRRHRYLSVVESPTK